MGGGALLRSHFYVFVKETFHRVLFCFSFCFCFFVSLYFGVSAFYSSLRGPSCRVANDSRHCALRRLTPPFVFLLFGTSFPRQESAGLQEGAGGPVGFEPVVERRGVVLASCSSASGVGARHAPSTVRPLAMDPRVLIGWPFPLGFGLDGRLLLARRGRVYV